MSSAEVHKRFVIRKIIAVTLLCLFAFRGLGFLGMNAPLAAAPGVGDLNSAHWVLGEHCRSGTNDVDPKHDRDNSECCVLCMSAARDAVVSTFLILAAVIVLSPIESNAPTKFVIENQAPTKPPGFRSSWSATSPPLLV
jgi:hypothetical protein